MASSVIGILAQRLVRVVCPKCKEKYIPSDEIIKDLGLSQKIELFRGKGCMHCRNTGFTGRLGIFELLTVTEEIKNMVTAKRSANEIKKKALEQGMRVLRDDGMEKVKSGVTTAEEVLRVTEET
jgi:type II secretory ATPase GspE/PulE/Tfp pilus assembly ATPase PilB-like protein